MGRVDSIVIEVRVLREITLFLHVVAERVTLNPKSDNNKIDKFIVVPQHFHVQNS